MKLKNLKRIGSFLEIVILIILVISLIYVAIYEFPEYKKQNVCWDYFFELKEKAGLRDITGFIMLNQTEEILKWGGYFNIKANAKINKELGYVKLCACLCDDDIE